MATETVLNKLTINSVESREVYKKMQEKGLINEDEIYLVSSDDAGEDYLANPEGGSSGQVLTKTDDGAEWKDAPKTTVPSTTKLINGNGSGGLVAATPETDYASPVFMRKVTLPVSHWSSATKQQDVTVTGVLADTTKQCIYPAPVDTSYDSAWNTCGIQAVAQGANSVTFQCSEIPTTAVEVFVTVITLSYKG